MRACFALCLPFSYSDVPLFLPFLWCVFRQCAGGPAVPLCQERTGFCHEPRALVLRAYEVLTFVSDERAAFVHNPGADARTLFFFGRSNGNAPIVCTPLQRPLSGFCCRISDPGPRPWHVCAVCDGITLSPPPPPFIVSCTCVAMAAASMGERPFEAIPFDHQKTSQYAFYPPRQMAHVHESI